jgi:hypothetical protein
VPVQLGDLRQRLGAPSQERGHAELEIGVPFDELAHAGLESPRADSSNLQPKGSQQPAYRVLVVAQLVDEALARQLELRV